MYLKRALRGTILVFIFSIIGSLFSYLFRILLARELTIAEYGLFYAMFSFFSVFTLFIDLGLTQAVSKHVIDLNVKKKFARSKSIIIGTMYFQLLLSGAIFIALLTFPKGLYAAVFDSQVKVLVIMMGIWFLTLPIVNFLINIFIGFKRVEIASSLELFRQVGAFTLSALFFYSRIGLKSPFLAYLFLNLLMLLFYAPIIRIIAPQFTNFKFKLKIQDIFLVLKFGYYITISSLISVVITQTDTILLTLMEGTATVGLYQIAMPLAMLILYTSGAVLTVAYPVFVEMNAKKEKAILRNAVEILYKYTLIVSLPIAIVIFSYPSLIISMLFDSKYVAAADTLQILAVMAVFALLTTINNTILLATGHPQEISKSMMVAAVINLILNIIFIPIWGIVGAATASAISFMFAETASYIKLKQKTGIWMSFYTLWTTFVIALAVGLAIDLLKVLLFMQLWMEVAVIGIIAAALYIILLFPFKLLDINELKHFIRTTLSGRT